MLSQCLIFPHLVSPNEDRKQTRSMRCIWLMSLRSLLGPGAQFFFHSSVWPSPGREAWLVSVHVQLKGPVLSSSSRPRHGSRGLTPSDKEHPFGLSYSPAPLGLTTALGDSHRLTRGTRLGWATLQLLWLCPAHILLLSFAELVFRLHAFVVWSSWGCSVTCAFGHVIHELGFGHSLSFSSFFSPLWWESGKIQKLWHGSQASEWDTHA